MLRITEVSRTLSLVTLKVEGRVAGEWVEVLERECQLHTSRDCAVRLDVADVSMIDCDGVAMLQRVLGFRVEIVNALPFIKALLAEEEECL